MFPELLDCAGWRGGGAYKLGVELGQAGLTCIVEDKDCVDHPGQ